MKLAGHTMGTPEYSLDDAMRLFKSIGLDGAEIIVQDRYKCALAEKSSISELQHVRELADSLGLEISCLTPYYSHFNSSDDSLRQHDMEGIRTVVEYAEILQAPCVRIYGGNISSDTTDNEEEMYSRLVESLQVLGNFAHAHGVRLAVENHFNTMTVSARQSIEISRRIGNPAVGILYDQANLAFTGNEDFQEAVSLQGEKIYYVHVKDLIFRSKDHTFSSSDVSHPDENERNVTTRIVGEGILDWQSILQILKDRGYDGWLSFEYERRWHPLDIPDAAIGMRQSAAYIRKCIAGLQ